METTDPQALREAMLKAVHDRATDDGFDPHAELREILAPLGLTPEDSGGSIKALIVALLSSDSFLYRVPTVKE